LKNGQFLVEQLARSVLLVLAFLLGSQKGTELSEWALESVLRHELPRGGKGTAEWLGRTRSFGLGAVKCQVASLMAIGDRDGAGWTWHVVVGAFLKPV
jgi:hypothetical protein